MSKITESVDFDRRGRVAVLTVNNPPVNALSRHVRQGLHEGLRQAAADAGVQAVVIACAGRTFIAGADITEFGKPPAEPSFHAVLDLIEGCPKPVVAAVHGTALGGGLEVTLACHYRVGVKAARFGLPEVKLGAMPGYGGTQRLARLVGLGRAVELMATGDHVDAEEAYRIGLANRVLPQAELVAACVALGEKIAAHGPLAVAAALEAAVRGRELALADGLALEAARFGELAATHDWREGMEAFLQKRKPGFRGR